MRDPETMAEIAKLSPIAVWAFALQLGWFQIFYKGEQYMCVLEHHKKPLRQILIPHGEHLEDNQAAMYEAVLRVADQLDQSVLQTAKDICMHDSGNRQTFSTGAVRDAAEDKPRPDLISPFAVERLGEWLRLGALKYKERNWEAGIPISRCIASLERHIMRYKQGDQSEDHMAAIMCNAMFVLHMEDMVDRGVLPEDMDDMPNYSGETDE